MNSRKTIIRNGTIVNEGRKERADIIIDNDRIDAIIYDGNIPRGDYYEIDAAGCFVLPGVIDSHVHFRDPGLTHKADIESESRAESEQSIHSTLTPLKLVIERLFYRYLYCIKLYMLCKEPLSDLATIQAI